MNNTETSIFNFLLKEIGNIYGVVGLMGNLKAESNCNPKNLQNAYEKKLGMTDDSYTTAVDNGKYDKFVNDSAGYGLAQWTYWSRKQNLLDYCKSKKTSIGDLQMQLEFLVKELKTYKSVWNTLVNATSIKEASDKVLTGYEKPANQDDTVKAKRLSYAEKYYNESFISIIEHNKLIEAKDKEIKELKDKIAKIKTIIG